MPDEAEAHGLLALMLLHESRRSARLRDGELVLLEDQDRSIWDEAQIEAGRAELERAAALQAGGQYTLQAAIAELHTEEPRDWRRIAMLYGELARLTRSPVVELNRAVAVAEADGPAAGLSLIDALHLDDYLYFHAARADLLRRLERREESRAAYERALALAHAEPERRFLQRRLDELE